MRRVFGLDLLRALAIGGVFVSHLHMTFWGAGADLAAAAGNLGVELFFVLSGFLIGGILLDILARGATVRAWGSFMVRRWMRTLPLYFLWMAVLLLFWPRPEGSGLRWAWHFLTLTQNLAWPMTRDWFQVSWSLMVEEWFYLFFATLLLALGAVWRTRATVWITCALFLVVPVLIRYRFDPGATTDWDSGVRKVVAMRLDAIAYGVVLVWLSRNIPERFDRFAWPALGLGLVLLAAGVVSGLSPRSYASLHWRALSFCVLSTGFALCFPLLLRLKTPTGLWGWLVAWTSQRSYGIYLVHLSVMEVARQAVVGGTVPLGVGFLAACLVPAGISELLYRLVERPVNARRPAQA